MLNFALLSILFLILLVSYLDWRYAAYLAWRLGGNGKALVHSAGATTYAELFGLAPKFLAVIHDCAELPAKCRIETQTEFGTVERDIRFATMSLFSSKRAHIAGFSLPLALFLLSQFNEGGILAFDFAPSFWRAMSIVWSAKLRIFFHRIFRIPLEVYIFLPKDVENVREMFFTIPSESGIDCYLASADNAREFAEKTETKPVLITILFG